MLPSRTTPASPTKTRCEFVTAIFDVCNLNSQTSRDILPFADHPHLSKPSTLPLPTTLASLNLKVELGMGLDLAGRKHQQLWGEPRVSLDPIGLQPLSAWL